MSPQGGRLAGFGILEPAERPVGELESPVGPDPRGFLYWTLPPVMSPGEHDGILRKLEPYV